MPFQRILICGLVLILSACSVNSGSTAVGTALIAPEVMVTTPLTGPGVNTVTDSKLNIVTENGYVSSQVLGPSLTQQTSVTENGFTFTSETDSE